MEIKTIIILSSIGITTGITLYYSCKYAYRVYNEIVHYELFVERQFSNIEVHLKKKLDLIPALLEIVKGYGEHEKGTLEEVTKMRSQWGSNKNNNDVEKANMLEGTLSKLLNIQEKYPELKADKRFQEIQESINEVERELVVERKLYNQRVNDYNMRLRLFPSNLVGRLFKFKEKQFYTIGGKI